MSSGVVDGLSSLTQLLALSVGNRKIDMSTAVALKIALQFLKQFSLANFWCEQELREIMLGLGVVPELEQLDLSSNDLSCAAPESAVALRCLICLQSLNLKYAMLESTGFGSGSGRFAWYAGIIEIDFSCNNAFKKYPGGAISALVALISETNSLRCVFFNQHDLYSHNSEAFRQLQECLEHATYNDPLRLVELEGVCGDVETRDWYAQFDDGGDIDWFPWVWIGSILCLNGKAAQVEPFGLPAAICNGV